MPYDDTTLFCPSGMQQFKREFSDLSYQGITRSNVQSCIRVNDLDQIGDGTHFGFFNMVGLFSFRSWTVSQTIDFWVKFLGQIGIKPTHVTVHPERHDWKKFYSLWEIPVKEDPECRWSDGTIGGFCTEFYVNGVEIGNIVNPLGTCIDVGFGLERLEQIVNGGKPKTRTEVLRETCSKLIESGIKPSGSRQGYILRKLLRKLWLENSTWDNPVYMSECERQRRLRDVYEKLSPKYPDKSPEWWFDTHGIDINLFKHS